MNSSLSWLDLMVDFQRQMQRASLQMFSTYSPSTATRVTGELPSVAATTTVIPVGEERLNVATHTIQGETTRIRRRVVSEPVEQQVTLRDETVVVERRPAIGVEPKAGLLTETVVEMTDTRQVPTVWKSVHVAEEIVLRKQVTERAETVRETVRRDVVDVENPHAALPAVISAAAREFPREVAREAEAQMSQRAHAAAADHDTRMAASGEKRGGEEDKKPAITGAPAVPAPAATPRKS